MTRSIDLLSLAWGDRRGHVVLSLRNPHKGKEDSGYWRDLVFAWPQERQRVESELIRAKSSAKDIYFAPAVFSKPHRDRHNVLPLDTLWADLDTVDPDSLPDELKPAAAWQTSPGRYQSLWKIDAELSPDQQSHLNQQLTYAIGADRGGWDLTQVLRIPGTANHKYPTTPQVKLEWLNGKISSALDLSLLPDAAERNVHDANVESVPDSENLLRARRGMLRGRPLALIRARSAKVGERSERLWELECLLAERGFQAAEIVSLVGPTVWNKFRGRRDELTRLFMDARKAIQNSGDRQVRRREESLSPAALNGGGESEEGSSPELEVIDGVVPLTAVEFEHDRRPLEWLVAEVWGEGEVGFVSGQPKTYKSWVALDLAVSVATGTHFLGAFACRQRNVLIIQEEDPKRILQDRLTKICASRGMIYAKIVGETIEFRYELPGNLFIISNEGFTINEEWLEELKGWITTRNLELVILDPLMMMGEGVDEFKAFEMMSQMLKPLKRVRHETGCAIAVVHHHTKDSSRTGGGAMYGSVALWAWEESGIHISLVGQQGRARLERFSKHDLLPTLEVQFGDVSERWHPSVNTAEDKGLLDVIETMEDGATVAELQQATGLGRDAVQRHLKQLLDGQAIIRAGSRGGARLYRAKPPSR